MGKFKNKQEKRTYRWSLNCLETGDFGMDKLLPETKKNRIFEFFLILALMT